MLQAVLLCLSGYDSPHIEISVEKSKYTSLQRKKIKFVDNACSVLGINRSEQQMLEEVIILGIDIKELTAFVKKYQYKNQHLSGLYIQSLCHAISALIEEYKHEIIVFRRQYAICPQNEQSISICRLQKTFKKYINLFQCINHNLCREIERKHLFGGQILGKLLDLVVLNGGNVFIKTNLNKLLQKILFIWYNQITSFVAYGILSDFYCEFFINQNQTYSHSHGAAQSHPGNNEKYELLSWNNQFLINYQMLPIKHIPNHIVDKIMFIGKSVRILNAFKYRKETTTNQNTLRSSPIANKPDKASAMAANLNDCDQISLSTSTTTNASFTHNGMNLMLTENEMFSLSQQLHKLKLHILPFNIQALESVLNQIKTAISHKLWAVLVFHLRLNDHLHILRDYFLLGNGMFWQCLLDECTDIPALETIPVTVASRDLNVGPFKSAATKCNITNHALFDKLALQFSLQKFSTRRKSIDLDQIITYKQCTKIARKTDMLLRFQFHKHYHAVKGAEHGHEQHAACWMKLKCPTQYGFSCRFNFEASGDAQSFALVIQHDRINWWLQHNYSNDMYGSDICFNSLVVGFSNDTQSKKQRVALFTYDGNGQKSVIQESDVYSKCFDSKQHAVGIVFCFAQSELKITIDDEIALFVNKFRISKYVQTEIATGRAWIGITSAYKHNHHDGDNKENEASNGNEGVVIDIIQWSFSGKFVFESYDNSEFDYVSNTGNDSWKYAMKFWSRLNLEYKISNPMDVLFNDYDLERYNGLFKFLLLLKRTHFHMNKCWKEMSIYIKQNRKKSSSMNSNLPDSVWSNILSISRRMLFFVNNFQFYIQFEVIDIEYKALLNKISGTKNIELVMEAHQIFLHSLCRQCFLIGNDNLWHYISKILCLVLQSTQLILSYIEKQQYFDNAQQGHYQENRFDEARYLKQFEDEIKRLQKAFDSSLSQWFELAKDISLNQQSLSKLQRLVSQLNYNNWFL